jgi:hypothetical protein
LIEIPMVIVLSHRRPPTGPLGQRRDLNSTPLLYILDLLLPIVGFGQKGAFNPRGWEQTRRGPGQRVLGGQAPGVSAETLHAIASGVRRPDADCTVMLSADRVPASSRRRPRLTALLS